MAYKKFYKMPYQHHTNSTISPKIQTMTEPNYWLMKSEPDAYSIDTLKNDGVTLWDGIRNYQARNFMDITF